MVGEDRALETPSIFGDACLKAPPTGSPSPLLPGHGERIVRVPAEVKRKKPLKNCGIGRKDERGAIEPA